MATNGTGPKLLHDLMKDMLEGLPTLPPGLTSLPVLGKSYSIADLGTKIGGYEATYAAVDTSEIAYHTAIADRNAIEPEAREFVMATKAALKSALGRKAPALRPLGVAPDKTPAPLTTEEQAEKVAKALATRAARHTMGKKAKAKIHGQVPPPAEATPSTTPPQTPLGQTTG